MNRKQVDELQTMIEDTAEAYKKGIFSEFKGLGPGVSTIPDVLYPQWFEMMRDKALKEQQAEGIIGWKWPDGTQTESAWEKVLSSGQVEGGRDEIRRYLKTKLAEMEGTNANH